MAYNDTPDEGMGGDETGPETNPDSGGEHEGSDTFYLPEDFVYSKDGGKCKPGDEIILKVVNVDEDGDIEVKMQAKKHQGEDKLDWRSDLHNSMSEEKV